MQRLAFVSFIIIATALVASAQSDPVLGDRKIAGVVVDRERLPIAGVTFTVNKGEVSRGFASDIDGTFELRLQPGDFVVTVNKANDRNFKLFLKIPESGPSPSGLRIILNPALTCCVNEKGNNFPVPVSLPRPQYPPAARAIRATGEVEVVLTIASDGSVESAQARTGHPLLRSASVAAAKRATFPSPASRENSTALLVFVFLVFDDKEATKARHRNPFRIEVFSENLVINAINTK